MSEEMVIDLRCDANPRRLFARLVQDQERPTYTEDGTCIEFSCRDCRAQLPKEQAGTRVLHRFNLLGELVETVVV